MCLQGLVPVETYVHMMEVLFIAHLLVHFAPPLSFQLSTHASAVEPTPGWPGDAGFDQWEIVRSSLLSIVFQDAEVVTSLSSYFQLGEVTNKVLLRASMILLWRETWPGLRNGMLGNKIGAASLLLRPFNACETFPTTLCTDVDSVQGK